MALCRWLRIGVPALALACVGCGDGAAPDPDAGTADTGAAGGDADLGCPEVPSPMAARTTPAPTGPLDDVLRVNHLQVEGTHNSYHIEPDLPVPDSAYTHAPLDVQLESQGVRKVELDLWWDARCGRYEVFHIGLVDEVTTCRAFTECLGVLRGWSDANPGHPPLFVQIEPKDRYVAANADERLATLDAEILLVWPREMLITPDDVRGSRGSVREGIVMDGWPTMAEARGKAVFFMNRGDGLRDHYTENRTTLAGRVMFAEGEPGDPIESVLVINGPVGAEARIQAAVAAGFLVRTRADSGLVEAMANDRTRLDAALRSGAHLISTDFPAPVAGYDYFVEIPGGAPSGCNPVTAPPECTAAAISLQR